MLRASAYVAALVGCPPLGKSHHRAAHFSLENITKRAADTENAPLYIINQRICTVMVHAVPSDKIKKDRSMSRLFGVALPDFKGAYLPNEKKTGSRKATRLFNY